MTNTEDAVEHVNFPVTKIPFPRDNLWSPARLLQKTDTDYRTREIKMFLTSF